MAAAIDTQFIVKQFGTGLRQVLGSTNTLTTEDAFNHLKVVHGKSDGKHAGVDGETRKVLMDQGFRDCLTNGYLAGESDTALDLTKCRTAVELSIKCARAEMCSVTLPIAVLADIFDVLNLEEAATFFPIVEENVVVWKEELFFAQIKNNLLRICNDLLRRLSRTQDTVFCGRILLFLARFFPFSERSGLNVISEFNLDNVTAYSDAPPAPTDSTEQMEVESKKIQIEKDSNNLNIDYNLYAKFWKLQDYFRNPLQCYQKDKWSEFSKFSTEVLRTFKSSKIDSVAAGTGSGGRKKLKSVGGSEHDMDTSREEEEGVYFAKYLTNQNLLQLQLSDSNFRRYFLLQCLILFQYLKSNVKFKTDTQVLSDDQSRWVEKSKKYVYDLLSETPPNGKEFGVAVRHILDREEQWNEWKNEGCKALKLQESKTGGVTTRPMKRPDGKAMTVSCGSIRKRSKPLGEQIKEANAKKRYLMGNKDLTKLWNLCPDNLEAASAPERDFLPSMDEYLSEAVEQLDPAQQVEESYRKVNDGQWGWRALRLLSKTSPYFFTYGNAPIGTLPKYLTTMLKKHYPDWDSKSKAEAAAAAEGANKEALNTSKDESGGDGKPATLSEEQLEKLAKNLAEKDWTKLAPKLGQGKTELDSYTKEESEDSQRALLMLKQWVKTDGEAATRDEIQYILEGLKMESVLEGVF